MAGNFRKDGSPAEAIEAKANVVKLQALTSLCSFPSSPFGKVCKRTLLSLAASVRRGWLRPGRFRGNRNSKPYVNTKKSRTLFFLGSFAKTGGTSSPSASAENIIPNLMSTQKVPHPFLGPFAETGDRRRPPPAGYQQTKKGAGPNFFSPVGPRLPEHEKKPIPHRINQCGYRTS